jgi:hypothetical protein
MKDVLLTIQITEEGEYIDTEVCSVSVPHDVATDNFDALFAALRDQCDYLYCEYPDSTFEIIDVDDLENG